MVGSAPAASVASASTLQSTSARCKLGETEEVLTPRAVCSRLIRAPAFTSASTSSALAPQPVDNLSGEPSYAVPSTEASGSGSRKGFLGGAGGLDDDDDEQASGSEASSDDSEQRPASPRVRDDDSDEEDGLPAMSSFAKGKGRAVEGFGLGSAPPSAAEPPSATQPSSSTGSGPAPKTGFFAPPMLSASAAAEGPSEGLPSAFQPKPKQARSFLPKSAAAPPPPSAAAADLSREDIQALNKLQGSFGARMLSKLGWSAGAGLGKEGEGIIAPIDVKLRPQKMGLGGVKERTEQSIKEAIRKGDMPAPEEKKKPQAKGVRGRKGADRDADGSEPSSARASGSGAGGEEWKRRKKLKTKVVHLTYEEILEQSGGAGSVSSGAGVGVIIDATGATVRTHVHLAVRASLLSSRLLPPQPAPRDFLARPLAALIQLATASDRAATRAPAQPPDDRQPDRHGARGARKGGRLGPRQEGATRAGRRSPEATTRGRGGPSVALLLCSELDLWSVRH